MRTFYILNFELKVSCLGNKKKVFADLNVNVVMVKCVGRGSVFEFNFTFMSV